MPGAVDSEPGDAVVAAIGHIEKLSRRRQVNLGAGVPFGESGGQACDGLHRRKGAGGTVEAIARHAAALLVGEVDEIPGGMKAVVARTEAFGGLDPAGRFLFAAGTASGQLASYRINTETGTLSPLAVYTVGQRPTAVLAARLGD